MRRRSLLALAAAGCLGLAAPALLAPAPRLVWNASPSVPIGLYRVRPGAVPQVGELAVVSPPPRLAALLDQRQYLPAGVPLVKPVAARTGARVCRTGPWVSIDGKPVAYARPRDRLGRPLPRWLGCRRLAGDEVLLIAPARSDSFDGRYFGPLPLRAIIGVATPLWVAPER